MTFKMPTITYRDGARLIANPYASYTLKLAQEFRAGFTLPLT